MKNTDNHINTHIPRKRVAAQSKAPTLTKGRASAARPVAAVQLRVKPSQANLPKLQRKGVGKIKRPAAHKPAAPKLRNNGRKQAENQKIRRSLQKMKRSELINIIDEMQNTQSQPLSRQEVLREKERLAYKENYLKAIRGTISVLLVVAAVAVLISAIFLPVLQVSGHSMVPVLEEGDVVVVWKNQNLQRGELCTFYYQNKLLIKRVIGLPGDEIHIDKEGTVYVNGQALDEPYVKDKALGEGDVEFPCQVPDNRYFVLGDHRSDSIDSRHELIGTIGNDELVGKILLRIWPLDRFSAVR